jgi:hypothetical protein
LPQRIYCDTAQAVVNPLCRSSVIEEFDVTREQVMAVLDFVADSLRADPVPTGAHPL